MALLFCLFKNERKQRTCYLLFGSYARSLFGGPVNAKIIVYCFRSAECFFHGLHDSLCTTIVVGSWTNFRLSICSCFVTQCIVVFSVTWSCSNKPSSSSFTLRCEEWNSNHWRTGGKSWTSYKFSPALRAVLSVLLHLFLLQVLNHTFVPVQRSNQLS